MSCHGTPATPDARGAISTLPGAAPLRVLLVGAPNVGKSTLFNALTGARQRTMNAPGTTVELFAGTWRTTDPKHPTPAVERAIVDLPGTYSLVARSVDEQVTADAVRELGDAAAGAAATAGSPDRRGVAVVVLDATALTRSLYLLAQVAETGAPVVVALTMLDLAAAAADSPTSAVPPAVLAAALTATLGVPVVPVDARSRTHEGLTALARAVDDVASRAPAVAGLALAPRADAGLDLAQELAHAEALFSWVEAVLGDLAALLGPAPGDAAVGSSPRRTFSDRVDAVLLNPWAGIPVFLAVVWLIFELTTKAAAPLQGAIDAVVSGPVAAGLTAVLSVAGLDDTWVRGLVVDGLLAGVGTVATFVPVMAVMFAALGVLEDSGYLARAAFVADRVMRSLGLDGRALLPLIIGFGCNLPALAATRTLPSSRQRLLTGLLIPLTSCAARLTVYILLAGAFFPTHAGTVIFAMYLVSVALVLGGGLLLRRTAFRDVRTEPLILVLPPYQRPGLRTLAASVVLRVGAFVGRAGKIIVATLLVVWVLMAVPATGGYSPGDVPVGESLYGRTAAGLAPVLAPAGFGNDHAAAALITGFVAKEVVVGSFAQSYAVPEPGDPAQAGDLGDRLRASFDESSGGHGGAAALAFMTFVLAYTPCVAALAEQKRLFGWRPTLWALSVQLVTAWLLAVAVFQVGSRL
ncbi:ferrous iron transporter B [Pengzhenrongella sicca]|uniref:Ferrous iron transporter B n=1 Tax=Pengzhenrongella sicca TaxID=2819238 RepID=A0A8A4Z7L1_9MICO|nr:ferrous iron transporter B [Pengzhenrongella sicca]QTE27890.1 ferrous iron transporter B [Pengzhenrongella sicca]